ncbi:dihydropyrimidinase [Bosea vaviloviae]|uniref:Dihydropyrimidinase n=1 Tax=Bosea vaviloviae TaxID=1526658 RepID=A0A1D7TZR1_9HYPH|nr:dihydropyrimidinase [Bosea vaviloviae]AOO80600.1 dihydropyrimidinase [Bosea vaviloviae]
MPTPAYDIVIRGGTLATATDVFKADLGIQAGRIAAIGLDLPAGVQEIDAKGRLVLPGGVDTHCHIEQLSGSGLMSADNFETATRSAAFGGTTSVISFAAQHRGANLASVVEEYAALAKKGAIIDYAFHLMVANPDEQTVTQDLPALIRAGHRSVKVFMTYDAVQVDDGQLLDVLMAARSAGALVCVHAENHGLLKWMGERLMKRGYTAPKYHSVSHPQAAEVEAFHRLIAFSELLDQPICIFHVSTAEGAKVIREARGRGVKIYAETCPHYLLMTAAELDKPGIEGAKWVCSPPQRGSSDQEALWQALALGDLQILSSDHAPYRFDETGKLKYGPNPGFKQIANGMPGLEMRLPVMFDAMVSQGRLGLKKFVELTATAPARIYDLPGKGSLAIGMDADIAVWDADRKIVLADNLHDNTGYNPFAGRTITGWPETVLRRGEVVVAQGALKAQPGSGRLMLREAGEATRPTGTLSPEFDPARNFGAKLY